MLYPPSDTPLYLHLTSPEETRCFCLLLHTSYVCWPGKHRAEPAEYFSWSLFLLFEALVEHCSKTSILHQTLAWLPEKEYKCVIFFILQLPFPTVLGCSLFTIIHKQLGSCTINDLVATVFQKSKFFNHSSFSMIFKNK